MRAGHEGRAAGQYLAHGIGGAVNGSPRVGLGLESLRRSRRGLLLGQAVDEVVHDDIGQPEVLAAGVVEMIPPYGEAIAITAKYEDMQVVPA